MESGTAGRQQISALADGELDDAQVKQALTELRDPAQQATWALYHQIGDVLRSDQMAAPVSQDFAARFAARLNAEPTLLAPAYNQATRGRITTASRWSTVLAVMAAASAALFVAPQLITLTAPGEAGGGAPTTGTQAALLADAGSVLTPPSPAIEPYIQFHQSAHPSLFGSAQLARPVTLTSEVKK